MELEIDTTCDRLRSIGSAPRGFGYSFDIHVAAFAALMGVHLRQFEPMAAFDAALAPPSPAQPVHATLNAACGSAMTPE